MGALNATSLADLRAVKVTGPSTTPPIIMRWFLIKIA